MGMYTEFHFNVELNKDIPKEIIEILQYMLVCPKEGVDSPVNLPEALLFQTTGWTWMLLKDSYYFDADTHSTLRFDAISNSYFLCIRSNLKNYGNEIQHFIDWIKPYLHKYEKDFLGFYRYEEDETPVLIFM